MAKAKNFDDLPEIRQPNPLPCGCAIVGRVGLNLEGTRTQNRDQHIKFCSTHAAAFELLKIIRRQKTSWPDHHREKGQCVVGFCTRCEIEKAIDDATPEVVKLEPAMKICWQCLHNPHKPGKCNHYFDKTNKCPCDMATREF